MSCQINRYIVFIINANYYETKQFVFFIFDVHKNSNLIFMLEVKSFNP